MKVVYLHQYFNTPQMSGGTRSFEFGRRLVASGHDVLLITSDRTGASSTRVTCEEGIRVTWIPVAYSNAMNVFNRIRAFLTFALRSAKIASRSEADVIFASSTPLTIAIPGVYAKWRQRIPLVFEVRDPWPEMLIGLGAIRHPILKWLARRFERFVYTNSDHIVALSEGMKDIVVATGYSSDRVTVIPNAADFERFSTSRGERQAFRERFEWLQHRKLVLYAGTIGFANGVDYLVDVAREMLRLDQDIRFLVIGDGGQREFVKQRAQESGTLNVNFFMMDPLSKSEIPAAFSAADISLVLLRDVPELWTNSSNKFFDGLAAGRPVVVNNVGWQSELLAQKNAGFDIDPCDFVRAARTLLDHLSDEVWLGEAGCNARNLAHSDFDRDTLAKTLESVLLQAAEKRVNLT